MLRTVALLLFLCAASLTCAHAQPAPGQPRLFDDAELARWVTDQVAGARAAAKKTCRRPVLRGKPLGGTADADSIALVEGATDTTPCLDHVASAGDPLDRLLVYPDAPKGLPVRRLRNRPLMTPIAPELTALDRVCAPLLARLQRAVRHEAACSPYLAGRRGQPGALVPMLRVASVAFSRVRLHLAQGRQQQAAELALDALRWSQDLARGGTDWVVTVISNGAAAAPLVGLELLLNDSKPLKPALLKQIESELVGLLASELHPLDTLIGDADTTLLYGYVPRLAGAAFTPPGGWGAFRMEEMAPPPGKQDDLGFADLRDHYGLITMVFRDLRADWSTICPRRARLDVCISGVKSRVVALATKALKEPMKLLTAAQTKGSPALRDARALIRKTLSRSLRALSVGGYIKYLRRTGFRPFSLQAARLHVAYRRLSAERGKCPSVADFDRAPLAALRVEPHTTAGRIGVHLDAPSGLIVLTPSMPIFVTPDGKQSKTGPRRVFLRCAVH